MRFSALIGFLLILGVPCLIAPRQMQRLVLAANERMGYVEPDSGFRRSTKYLRRLRLIGALSILVAVILVFIDDIARAVI